MFDVADHLDQLRCRETGWLHARRDELVREQRRLHVEELAVTKVLDERRALGPDLAERDGVSAQTARATLETARRLEALPEVSAAAYAGELSMEQLAPVVQLADEGSDGEWAASAPSTAPQELSRQARLARTPTREEGHRRREARFLRRWVDRDRGMFCGRFELPDVDGAFFNSVLDQMIEKMRPAKGQPWDTYEHRGADALVELCRVCADTNIEDVAGGRPIPHFVVHVTKDGPAEIAGIPLPDDMVESLRAQARIEPVLVDDHSAPLLAGRVRGAVSEKIKRAILLRDAHRCQCGNCDTRHGLEIHHLVPRSWGGTDDPGNLASVCAIGGSSHHPMLVPHGDWVLEGNPALPNGLRLVHWTDAQHITPPPEWIAARRRERPERRRPPQRRPRAGPPTA
jgi:hypothetical protein